MVAGEEGNRTVARLWVSLAIGQLESRNCKADAATQTTFSMRRSENYIVGVIRHL